MPILFFHIQQKKEIDFVLKSSPSVLESLVCIAIATVVVVVVVVVVNAAIQNNCTRNSYGKARQTKNTKKPNQMPNEKNRVREKCITRKRANREQGAKREEKRREGIYREKKRKK